MYSILEWYGIRHGTPTTTAVVDLDLHTHVDLVQIKHMYLLVGRILRMYSRTCKGATAVLLHARTVPSIRYGTPVHFNIAQLSWFIQ